MLSFASVEVQRRNERLSRKPKTRKRRTATSSEATAADPNGDPSATQIAAALPQTQAHPLYHAIASDLMAIQNQFCEAIQQKYPQHNNNGSTSLSSTGAVRGDAFACFRQVAKSNQLSTLHTLVPPKCDAASFSQLIYSICLDMMDTTPTKKATDNANDVVDPTHHLRSTFQAHLPQTAFAIFALYTLHETNPLPTAPGTSLGMNRDNNTGHPPEPEDHPPTQASTLLSAMPMGLNNRQNPKLLFRRNFRPGIRLGPETFARLLVLRQQCLGHHHHNALALDTGTVLDRLWPHFVLAAYLGPMSLHGLAQRQLRRQQELLLGNHNNNNNTILAGDSHDANVAVVEKGLNDKGKREEDDEEEDAETMQLVQERMESYLKSQRKLRLPPPNSKSQRFRTLRQVMQPMAKTRENNRFRSWEERIQSALRGGQMESKENETSLQPKNSNDIPGTSTTTTRLERPEPVVTFALPADSDIPKCGVLEGVAENDEDAEGPDADSKFHAETSQPFDLVLPAGIDSTVRNSIESIVQSLVHRYDKTIFQMPLSASNEEDISTLGGQSQGMQRSVAASVGTASAVGRTALQALLAEVTETGAENRPLKRKAVSDPASFLHGYHEQEEPKKKAGKKKQPSKQRHGRANRQQGIVDSEDISDMSDDDAFSAANVSTVGRQALEDLIQEASHATRPAKKKRKPAKRARSPAPKAQGIWREEEQGSRFHESPTAPSNHKEKSRYCCS